MALAQQPDDGSPIVVLLHIFEKDTDKLPARDREMAIKRLEDFKASRELRKTTPIAAHLRERRFELGLTQTGGCDRRRHVAHGDLASRERRTYAKPCNAAEDRRGAR